MVTVLEGVLPKSSLLVCHFVGKGLNEKDIHKEIFPVYGGKCFWGKVVHDCVEKFSQGRSKVADDARRVRPVKISREASVQVWKSWLEQTEG
jgi:hypothetical protein